MSSKLIYHTNESINGGFSPFDEAIHQVSNSKELLIACPYIDVSYIKIYLNSDAPIIKSKIIDPEEAEQKASKSNGIKLSEPEPWNGCDFYINLGEGKHRNWDDCQRYGFISGGSEEKYNRPLIKFLSPGSRVFVYIPQTGYVGVGLVTHPAVPVRDFNVLVNGQQVPILDAPTVAPSMDEYADDLNKSEYLVRVKWIKKVSKSEAYRYETGLFTYSNIVCRMESTKSRLTIEKLSQYFELDD